MSSSKNKVKSVEKIFDILETLAENDGHLKLTELSNILNYPSSTTHRFLNSLIDKGYANQSENGEYTLGVKLLYLSNVVLNNLDLRKVALPFLNRLCKKTGETTNLVILDQGEVLYIEKVESNASIRAFSLIGRRAPVHATGVGKILLADMAWSEVVKILKEKGMKKLTSNTITNLDMFLDELNKVRKNNFALDKEECEQGAICIAAPIKNHMGKTIASISLSGPKSRLTESNLPDLITMTKNAAIEISFTLGYKPV